MMQLSKLEIERVRYGDKKGQFSGLIKFDNEVGEVSITLSQEKCEQLFMVCADGLIETAKKAAQELACTVIDHKVALEQDL